MNTHEIKERLEDIISRMIKQEVGELNSNKIYCSIISEYSSYEKKRNIIAHGRVQLDVSEEDLDKLILFILLIICIVEGKGNSFETLAASL